MQSIDEALVVLAENSVEDGNKLQQLPDVILFEMGKLMNESEMQQVTLVSKKMHSIFQPNKLLSKFLQCVAFGKQEEVEQLFKDVYLDDPIKIQEAIRHQGKFTDYSGRSFNCSTYEYAYWAKDIHMCRMLERYMNEETKAQILARITAIDEKGLVYQQHGQAHRCSHFDFTRLINALDAYITDFDALYAARDWASIEAAWLAIGMAQRDVPAHVAQEYCRPDRSLGPRYEFNEETLPRFLTFYNWSTGRNNTWFPLPAANTGIGFDLAIARGGGITGYAVGEQPVAYHIGCSSLRVDLVAIRRLAEVRTNDLALLREHLKPDLSPIIGL